MKSLRFNSIYICKLYSFKLKNIYIKKTINI